MWIDCVQFKRSVRVLTIFPITFSIRWWSIAHFSSALWRSRESYFSCCMRSIDVDKLATCFSSKKQSSNDFVCADFVFKLASLFCSHSYWMQMICWNTSSLPIWLRKLIRNCSCTSFKLCANVRCSNSSASLAASRRSMGDNFNAGTISMLDDDLSIYCLSFTRQLTFTMPLS